MASRTLEWLAEDRSQATLGCQAPARVEAAVGLAAAQHALHLQAVDGHVMDQKQIAEAAEAWAQREAEATAGRQAPASRLVHSEHIRQETMTALPVDLYHWFRQWCHAIWTDDWLDHLDGH